MHNAHNGCKMTKDLKWPEWHTEIRHILPKQDNAQNDQTET